MNDNSQQNQSGQGETLINPIVPGITPPPVPPQIIPPTPIQTETQTTAQEPTPILVSDTPLPIKKRNKAFPAVIAALSVFLIVGVAGATFYISNRLSSQTALAPTAPASEPMAASTDNGVCAATHYNCSKGTSGWTNDWDTASPNHQWWCNGPNAAHPGGGSGVGDVLCSESKVTPSRPPTCDISPATGLTIENISPTKVKLKWTPGKGTYVKMWVATTDNPTSACSSLNSKSTSATCPVNENTDYDIKATPSEYEVSNLKADTTYYWRLMMWDYPGCDNAAAVKSFKTLSTPSVVVGNCVELKAYKPGTSGTAPILMTQAELDSLNKNSVVLLACKGSIANLTAQFTISQTGGVAPTQDVFRSTGYLDSAKMISTYSYTVKDVGNYKFSAQVSSKPL